MSKFILSKRQSTNTSDKQINFRMTKESYEELRSVADEYGYTSSVLVREMVAHCLNDIRSKATDNARDAVQGE